MNTEPRRVLVPREYQVLARDFLLDTPRAMLAAPPGMGKTGTTMMVLDLLKMAGSNFFPALVIAPKNVAKVVWTNEAAKWDAFKGLTVRRILGTPEQRRNAMRAAPVADVYTINYENVEWLIKTLGDRWPFKIVICDESTKLKNFRLNSGGVRSTKLSYIAKHTGRWINLTGTPAPNGLQDLWGQLWFVDFGERLLRTHTDFMAHWFNVNQYTREIKLLPGAEKEIHDRLAGVMLSLRVEDWFDIQEPLKTSVPVELPKEARAKYADMERRFFAEIGDVGIEALSAAAKSSKLLQIASGSIYDEHHVAHHVHDAKNEALRSVVNELQEPLLVVYWWNFDVPRILKEFPEARVYRGERDRVDWNKGRVPMLLLNPAEGGHGLDFQDGGRAICHYTQTWDAELQEQVNQRIGAVRQLQSGHHRAVLEYYLTATDTLDVEVYERVAEKLSVQNALMRARSRRN